MFLVIVACVVCGVAVGAPVARVIARALGV